MHSFVTSLCLTFTGATCQVGACLDLGLPPCHWKPQGPSRAIRTFSPHAQRTEGRHAIQTDSVPGPSSTPS